MSNTSIDQVRILLARLGEWTLFKSKRSEKISKIVKAIQYHAKKTILRLKLNMNTWANIVRCKSRDTNAEVAIHAILNARNGSIR